ncbi:MAG: hypothetical protein ACLRQF_15635 [Thomasclavelia ramosa]
MNCKVIEVNTARVINEFEEEEIEITVELRQLELLSLSLERTINN